MPTPATVRYLYPGTANIVAHCEGKDSNPCVVTVSAPPPGGLYPNKPADCIRFAESPMTGPTAGSGAFGSWGDSNPYNIAGVGFGTDAGDTYSPSGVRTDRLYQGMVPGIGSGAGLSGWGSPAVFMRKLYAAWTFKLVELRYYTGGITPLTKIGFITFGSDGGPNVNGNSGIIGFRHDEGYSYVVNGYLEGQCEIMFAQQNNVARRLYAQTGGRPFIFGQFNLIEHVAILNSAVNVADGVYQQWVNNTLTHDYHDVVWRTTNGPNPFGQFRPCGLTWGGMGTGSKPADENFRVGHCYLAGVPYA